MSDELPQITDEEMRAGLAGTREYTVVFLRGTGIERTPEVEATIWEHGRRNFGLRADGLLSVVCPVLDDSEVCGIGIFAVDLEAANDLMAEDPGVQAGVFTFKAHPVRSFPGDALPS